MWAMTGTPKGAILSTKRFIVRPATAGDTDAMSAVLASSGLTSARPEILAFYLASPGSQLFVGCRDDRVIGVAGCVSFGRTGWLGSVAVDHDARGQGLGTAISETAVECLRQAGVKTVLLTATELGQPIYERLGFLDEDVAYGIWERDQACVVAREDAAAVRPGRIEDAIRQDADATGEDRRSYLAAWAHRSRAAAEREQAGYRLALPWGGGPIVASCAATARALLIDMIRTSSGSRLAFPEANSDGADLAMSLGFRLARRVRRMRLGPPVRFRPEMIYNVFSLAAG
jgi:predicted N-acetyltransferase YhbS